jgi:hypothetical protein
MSLARYFVFPHGAEWVISLDGMPIARHPRQADAVQSAIVMADLMGAMKHDADVMVEEDGSLSTAWTYGAGQPMPAAPWSAK